MPELYANKWIVTKEELVPAFWKSYSALKVEIWRYKNKSYGIKRVTSGGNGRKLRIDFYSLPKHVQEAIGDPQAHTHWLLHFYEDQNERIYDYYADEFQYPDGTRLKPAIRNQYITNAKTVEAILKLKEERYNERVNLGATAPNKGLLNSLLTDLKTFNPYLKKAHNVEHTLPTSYKHFKNMLNNFEKNSYRSLIKDADGKVRRNAVKVGEDKAQSVLRQLLRKHNNFDNEQIAELYNGMADVMQWKTIDAVTVANYRKKWNMTTISGRRGKKALDNNIAMQFKRKKPSYPLYYWTADGWDVELFYQKTEKNSKGHNTTTYTNRLTAVIVLDPFNNYPVGYAIGTNESPYLIRQAFRNAIKNIERLFGTKYKPLQIQTDNYAKENLKPFYQGTAVKHTPAKVGNAKAKVIEPWFKSLNKRLQLAPNWAGFGVTANKEAQPNDEYLNKIRKQFPDRQGCENQIIRVLEQIRAETEAEYIQTFAEMPAKDKIPMSEEYYLYKMGEITGYTNRLRGEGLLATLNGVQRTYDCFDLDFRQNAHLDWAVKFDPDDLERVLVCDAVSDKKGKLVEIVGQHRYMLEEKYLQPMALREQTDEDVAQKELTNNFNREMEAHILAQMQEDYDATQELFNENRKLQETHAKMLIMDSNGQHKNNKAKSRLNTAKYDEQEIDLNEKLKEGWNAERSQYINEKVNINKYIG